MLLEHVTVQNLVQQKKRTHFAWFFSSTWIMPQVLSFLLISCLDPPLMLLMLTPFMSTPLNPADLGQFQTLSFRRRMFTFLNVSRMISLSRWWVHVGGFLLHALLSVSRLWQSHSAPMKTLAHAQATIAKLTIGINHVAHTKIKLFISVSARCMNNCNTA